MGQGGQIIIVNATQFPFQLQATGDTQMNDWAFPGTIAPGTDSGRIYIEYSAAIFDNPEKDQGYATFMIADGASNPTFQLQARSTDSGPFVQVEFLTLTMSNNAASSTYMLQQMDSEEGSSDWDCAKIVIAGSPGKYIGTNPPTNWMQTMLPLLQNRTLRQVCLPGSHDSGMSSLSGSTSESGTRDTQTQTLTIGQQLAAGVRYFDIRASLNGATYGTAHFSDAPAPLGWQGSFGQVMSDIIQEVNAFTANNAELIIFDVSHAMDLTGYEDNNVNNFSQEQYKGLMLQLQQVNNRCTVIKDLSTDASLMTVGDFIGNGQASVLFVIRDSQADLSKFAGQGFINDAQLSVYNNYADSDDLNTVISNQIQQLGTQRTSPDSPMFLLAWIQTLTSALDNLNGSILANTVDLNKALFDQLWSACSKSSYPNVLQVDGVDSTITALAIAINYQFGSSS